MEIIDYIGNLELLKLEKTAFLCSRKISASAVSKCYEWAKAQREKWNCIICGFHSQAEKDVLHYLLNGDQPIIIAMPRGIKQRIEPELKQEIEQGRLLIISPFEKDVKRITEETIVTRNRLMIYLADNLVIGNTKKDENLIKLLKQTKKETIKLR